MRFQVQLLIIEPSLHYTPYFIKIPELIITVNSKIHINDPILSLTSLILTLHLTLKIDQNLYEGGESILYGGCTSLSREEARSRLAGGSTWTVEPGFSESVSQLPQAAASSTPTGLAGVD